MPQDVPAGWTLASNSLTRKIVCADFVAALALVIEIGRLAEAANHHPNIDIRYRNVFLSLNTHSAGHTVTDKDFELAQKINDLSDESLRLTKSELQRRFAS